MQRFYHALILAMIISSVACGAHAKQPSTHELLVELRDREEAINNTYTIIGKYKEELFQKFAISALLAATIAALPETQALEWIKDCAEIGEKVHTASEGRDAFELMRLILENQRRAKERERELTSWVVSTKNDAVWKEYKQYLEDLKVRKEMQAKADQRGSTSCKSKKTQPKIQPSAQAPTQQPSIGSTNHKGQCDELAREIQLSQGKPRGQLNVDVATRKRQELNCDGDQPTVATQPPPRRPQGQVICGIDVRC
jgi:hypothetical protein